MRLITSVMFRAMTLRCLAIAVCLAPLYAAAPARAGNDDELFVGNQAAMLGGAVSATVSDSSATWYNPAGLGASERDQVDVSATVYTLRLYHSPVFIQSADGSRTSGGVSELVVAPAQVAFVRRLRPGLSLGVGYFVPRSTNYALRESLSAGPAGTPSEWQVAVAVADTQHIGALALGYALGPSVRVGASLYGGYASSNNAFMLYGSRARAGAPNAVSSANLIGTTSRLSLELGVGLQVDVTDRLRLGVSLRSPQLLLYSGSDSMINRVTSSVDDAGAGELATQARHPHSSHGLGLWRAGRAGLALSYRYGDGSLSAEIDVQPPLERASLELRRETLVNARVGLYHALSPAFALGFGLFTDRSSQAVSWQVVSVRGDYYGATFGVEYNNQHLLAAGERANTLEFNGVVALRYAYSAGDFSTLLVDAAKLPGMPFGAAKGELNVHELGLYVGSGLRF